MKVVSHLSEIIQKENPSPHTFFSSTFKIPHFHNLYHMLRVHSVDIPESFCKKTKGVKTWCSWIMYCVMKAFFPSTKCYVFTCSFVIIFLPIPFKLQCCTSHQYSTGNKSSKITWHYFFFYESYHSCLHH